MIDDEQEGTFHSEDEGVTKQEAVPLQKVVRMTKQDITLLAILLEDEDAYFIELDKQFGKRLREHLGKAVRDEYRKDVDDFVQITFVRFYIWMLNQRKAAKEIQVNHNSYLRTIAEHVYDDEIKKRKRLPTQSLDQPLGNHKESTNSSLADQQMDPHGPEWQEQKIFLKQVRDTIDSLKEPYRTVLILSKIEDRSDKEIGELLNKPLNTVKSLIRRGRNMLKAQFPEHKDFL